MKHFCVNPHQVRYAVVEYSQHLTRWRGRFGYGFTLLYNCCSESCLQCACS